MQHYKSIFISDIHLGTRGCSAEELLHFLKNTTCDNLFLVGDIIDGWQLKKRWYFPQSHVNIIRDFLTKTKRGTRVYYIIGNHDETLRKFLSFQLTVGSIKFKNTHDYFGLDGKKYLIVHGDMFDSLMVYPKKWLMHIGDNLYVSLIWMNTKLNKIRSMFGMKYWSLSNFLKKNTKQALTFITKYEEHIAKYCKEKGYDGVICGHIHTAEIKEIDGITYMNDGDWVESRTALVEHTDGRWELINYDKDFADN